MMCPKCEGKGWVWLQRTEHVSIADICQTCNGTGEADNQPERKYFCRADGSECACLGGYHPIPTEPDGDAEQHCVPWEYLRSDLAVEREKVRELVEAVRKLRLYAWDCLETKRQRETFVNLNATVQCNINALFPEGLGGEG